MNVPRLSPEWCGLLPRRRLCVVLAGMVAVQAVPGAPRISEFMAENKAILADEDGQYVDWIELHNPDGAPANLAGYALTDDPALPGKWVFPPVVLPADGYLIVFASGKNRAAAGAPLHANFSLDNDGEYLALLAPGGSVVLSEFAPFPAQPEEVSYGWGRDVGKEAILASGAACRWKVPTGELPGWQGAGFDDAGWSAGLTGVGYDTKTSGLLFAPYIGAGSNVIGPMYQLNATCYIRVPFVETTPGSVVRLILRMKYDDGFAAYLNGTKVAERNSAKTLTAFSDAPAYTWDDAALRDEEIDLTAFRHLLVTGPNLLAIHGQNDSSGNRDFLIVPALDVERVNAAAPLRKGYFATPTPGGVNGQPVDGFVAAPAFSAGRGFRDAPVNVVLASSTPGAEIRYTTDGSTPSAVHGALYTGPVTVSATTVLRAAAIKAGWHTSPVVTHSYLFPAGIVQQPALPAGYPDKWGQMINGASIADVLADYQMDPGVVNHPDYAALIDGALRNSLPVVSIATPADPLFGSGGLYAGGRTGEVELPVSLEYFVPGTAEQIAANCGLQMHGGRAREHIKKPFRLYFRKEYGTGKLRHPLFADSPVSSFDQLLLRPAGHDSWTATGFGNRPTDVNFHASYLRDQFARKTALDMGSLAPAGRYVHLYLNGLYWGVYDLHERPNAQFFADHLGGAEEDWDVLHHPEVAGDPYSLAGGTGAAWDSVLAAATAGITTPAAYQSIQQVLNLDHFIDMLILRMWASDYDWMQPIYLRRGGLEYFAGGYTNKNWYAGRRSRNAVDTFHFFPWDAEFSMGLSYLLSQSQGSLPAELGNPPMQHVLDLDHTRISDYGGPAWPYAALRKHPEFRSRFADRLQKHFFNDGALTPAKTISRFQSLEAQLDLPMVAESARWGDSLTGQPDPVTFTRNAHWRPEVAWLKDVFAVQRNDIVLGQFRSVGLYPFVEAPAFSQNGGVVASGFQLALTNPNAGGGTIYYTLDGTDPMEPPATGQALLAGGASACQYWIPTSGTLGTTWRTLADPANLASWSSGLAALGFDADAANAFGPHISTNLAAMQNSNASVYVRIPFTLTAQDLAAITNLELRMKYDDGFSAYLNGTLVQRVLAAGNAAWNSAATGAHEDAMAMQFESFPLAAHLGKLVAGTNVLAIQGLNASAADDDFLIAPELVATRILPGPAAAGGIEYAGPISLLQTGVARARVRAASGEWSALSQAAFIVGQPASAANLVLSELHYHPADPTAAEKLAGFTSATMFEFLELQNISSDPVELAGVRFTAGVVFDFADSSITTLPPGGRMLIVSNPAALTFRYGAGLPIAGAFGGGKNLANSGERLALRAAGGSMIFDFTFGDETPWPEGADGGGFSLVLRRPASAPDPAVASHWRLSVHPNGTPGGTDADTFSAWAGRNAMGADAQADSDHDGIPLLLEYALGLNPHAPDAATGISSDLAGSVLTLTFPHARGADDVEFAPEAAASLNGWMPAAGGFAPVADTGAGPEILTFQLPLPEPLPPTQFVRLRCRQLP